ncbi:hypothetical protein RclHR1_13010007 [Rhizophagus clarus]|uniref:Uncharacterized protein n=1 Tax=Rhizophagus clarus TaxID=94130 RepID=A0A2Z6QPK2_9GLOM|nr:hypothetical protein RclHR1_13010007 [Rhizophagus clarus]
MNFDVLPPLFSVSYFNHRNILSFVIFLNIVKEKSFLSALQSFSRLSISTGSVIIGSTNDMAISKQSSSLIFNKKFQIFLYIIYPFIWMNISIIFWNIHFFSFILLKIVIRLKCFPKYIDDPQ